MSLRDFTLGLVAQEVQDEIDCYYPGVFLKPRPGGFYHVCQTERRLDFIELACGLEFAFAVDGASILFDTKYRLVGSWIVDELRRRDPRYWMNPDNYFHEAFKASRQAEVDHEADQRRTRESAARSWEIAKRNEGLMGRIYAAMEAGRWDLAAEELSPEKMMKAAYIEKPQEIRDPKFWKSI